MKQERASVLVLGSFHMSAYGELLFSEKRQKEIEELVSNLEGFRPTKIAVEMVPEDSKRCNEKYQQYKRGTYEPEMNEIFQVGFRLGSRMGHEQIFPTDWMGDSDMSYGEVASWAKENQPALLDEIHEGFEFPKLTEEKSVIDYYKELNSPTLINNLHKMYVNIARIGHLNNYIGMNWLSWWYKRNLIMFANVSRLVESEEERVLFIVGASHTSIVSKFLEESDICEIVQPLIYLS